MDIELRCPLCKDYYRLPLYLPCHHSLCATCAHSIQQNISVDISQNVNSKSKHNKNIVVRNSITGSDLGSLSFASDLDKLSLISDNDSGVAVSSASSSSSCSSSITRPNSLIVSPIVPPALPEISILNGMSFTSSTKNPLLSITKTTTTSSYSTYLQCPICSKYIYMDQTGVKSLPENHLLKDILIRYIETKKISAKELLPKCQLCEEQQPQQSDKNNNFNIQDNIIQLCEQCLVYYCEKCREQYHPIRGPYAKHNFIKQTDYLSHLSSPTKIISSSIDNKICPDHQNRLLNLYCIYCHIECCQQCMQENHVQHETIPILQATKAYKTQLSTQLQNLSEKAKQGTDFLTKLKTYPDHIKVNGLY
ncbi:unnamed protein product [Didymodactylos carnosus]|uniref:B box-type domain-containing protein n=1 Tax=Didymodactylos carnosus TaxID=1234261 RepID=A0A8S2HRC1_9BILA|nr:unnamed protein product [Didymodactylos carnosus]CAF3675858.1 unnamed protein product [Didymodactylos carnosus]